MNQQRSCRLHARQTCSTFVAPPVVAIMLTKETTMLIELGKVSEETKGLKNSTKIDPDGSGDRNYNLVSFE
jgi:hypothetical protein